MASINYTNETFKSNYPTAPNGVVYTEALVVKHPLASGSAAGTAVTRSIDVGGADKNTDGVGTRSDRKII